MQKFKQSASGEFKTEICNTGIKMYQKIESDYTFIILDIFYNSMSDYQARHKYESNNKKWQEIWFSKNNVHTQVSVELLECIN
jgi:hypothetical protein